MRKYTNSVKLFFLIILTNVAFASDSVGTVENKENFNPNSPPPTVHPRQTIENRKSVESKTYPLKGVLREKKKAGDLVDMGQESDSKDQDDKHEDVHKDVHKLKKSYHNYSLVVVGVLREYGIDPDFLWLINRYISYHREQKEIRKNVKTLEKRFAKLFDLIVDTVQVIKNQNYIDDRIIYKDLLEKVHRTTGIGSMDGLVANLERHNLRVLDITPEFYRTEPRIESEKERSARKIHEKELLKRVLENSEIDHQKISSVESFEEESWKEYVKYFNKRKNDIDSKTNNKKITRGEIEHIFDSTVAHHYESFKSNGTFFYSLTTILWDLKKDGLTNLQRLQGGLAPIGVDGVAMNVHHVTHQQPGYYVLLTQEFHQKNNGNLHFKSQNHYPIEKNINRPEFERIKKVIFQKLARIIEKTEATS